MMTSTIYRVMEVMYEALLNYKADMHSKSIFFHRYVIQHAAWRNGPIVISHTIFFLNLPCHPTMHIDGICIVCKSSSRHLTSPDVHCTCKIERFDENIRTKTIKEIKKTKNRKAKKIMTHISFRETPSPRTKGDDCWSVSSCWVTSSAQRQLTSSWSSREALINR